MSDREILSVNIRSYPHPSGAVIDVICVLVAGGVGDYAAYVAAGRDAQFAAAHGHKLSFEEASIHFLGLEEARYRR